MDRRDFLKTVGLLTAGAAMSGKLPFTSTALASSPSAQSGKPEVFFTRDISIDGLKRIYGRVNRFITGKVAVKLHTGEPNGPNIIRPEMAKPLLDVIPNATIVETNVFYNSPRQTTEGHRETLKINGWTFSPIDIMDADGEVNLPVPDGKWFKEIAMGKNLVNYDSMLVLTHFKGHTMGGYGGSMKNIAIGCASANGGKKQIHQDGSNQWGHTHERFMENMADSAKTVCCHFDSKIAYINVMNKMSVDCDCAGIAAEPPTVPDIGILASTDILAIDQACIDLLYALPADQKKHLVERIESRKGLHQLAAMERLGMGSRQYDLVSID